MVKFLTNGNYRIPARITFTRHLEKKYKDVLDSVKTVLSKQASVSLTTDAWSSMHMESFTTVTAHYLTSE